MNPFSGVTSEKYQMLHHTFSCLKSYLNYTFYSFDLSYLKEEILAIYRSGYFPDWSQPA